MASVGLYTSNFSRSLKNPISGSQQSLFGQNRADENFLRNKALSVFHTHQGLTWCKKITKLVSQFCTSNICTDREALSYMTSCYICYQNVNRAVDIIHYVQRENPFFLWEKASQVPHMLLMYLVDLIYAYHVKRIACRSKG